MSLNSNPVIYAKEEESDSQGNKSIQRFADLARLDPDVEDEINSEDIFNILRNINDPGLRSFLIE